MSFKELMRDVVDKVFTIFNDSELRTFVCGESIDATDEEKKKFKKDLIVHLNKTFNMFYGVTNALYAYLVAAFSDKMTREMAMANNQTRTSKFCVEGVEDAIFGLYDTYDATDDLIKFVVFNSSLALGNDPALCSDLGLRVNSEFIERPISDGDVAEDRREDGLREKEENLLSIFRWMFSLRKRLENRIVDEINAHAEETATRLLRLLEYASFFKNVSLVPDGDTGSYDFVLHNEDEERSVKKVFKSHYVVFKNRSEFYLLRSVETEKKKESFLTLKYTTSNTSELDVKNEWEMIDPGMKELWEDSATFRLRVKSVGETYSEITNGLIRKRSRSTFCGGLSGYKYYTELAASIIDAIETMRKEKSVATYLKDLIKDPKNFSICKDECKCTRPTCDNDMEKCHGSKSFEHPVFDEKCLSNMRLLPILTLLLIVAGSKSILPQVYKCVSCDNPNPDDLFKAINKQLSLRFTNYRPNKVRAEAMNSYESTLERSSLTFDLRQPFPSQLGPTLNKLKARAYTAAIVEELEWIENCFENRDERPSVGNVDSYSIKEMYDALSRAEKPSQDTYMADVKYAKFCLRRVLMTILCFYKGLAHCVEKQFDYEIDLENSMKDGAVNTETYSNAIKNMFFEGVTKELIYLEGEDYLEHPHVPTFYELFKELQDLNIKESARCNADNINVLNRINLMLGRDILDSKEFFKLVWFPPDEKSSWIADGELNPDVDPKFEQLPAYIRGIQDILGYLYNHNIYPQVLTFSSTMINRDGNIIRKFMFYANENRGKRGGGEDEYNVFSFFDYEINKQYFFVPPKKCENSNWLTHPILIGCSEFSEAVFGNLPKENDNE